MCQYQSMIIEVEIKIISFESFLNLTFLGLFNFCCDMIEDLFKIFLRNAKI